MLTEPHTHKRDTPTGGISISSACDALADAIATMTISNASRPPRTRPGSDTGSQRITRQAGEFSNLDMLKMRLAIFLYGHPTTNMSQVMVAIENARTTGEVKLLLDYILVSRGHAARANVDSTEC